MCIDKVFTADLGVAVDQQIPSTNNVNPVATCSLEVVQNTKGEDLPQ